MRRKRSREPQQSRDEYQTGESIGYKQPAGQGGRSPGWGVPRPSALSVVRTAPHGRQDTVPGVWSPGTVCPQWLGCPFCFDPIVPKATSPPQAPSHPAEAPTLLPAAGAGAPAPTGRRSPKGEEERDADGQSAGTNNCRRKRFKKSVFFLSSSSFPGVLCRTHS